MKYSYLATIICLLLVSYRATAQDVPGSKDHPMISRYPGSVIAYYEEQKYAIYNVATGPETGYKKIEKWTPVEGKLTRIYYTLKGTTTLTEIYRNYLSALNKNSFKVLAQGIDDKSNVSKEVGGRTFLVTFFASNPFPASKGIDLLNGSATSGGSCYIAAQLQQAGGNVHIVISGTQYKADEKLFMIDVIEGTKMEDDLVKITADAMLKDIQTNGKVAVYSIFFDFDKTEVKPESKPALDEVAKLLSQNPQLSLYVVGHTDLKGTLEYNLNLSKKRAEAIVNELVKNYNINPSRLSAQGVGPLVPVATNKNEKGAALNRRVELVER